MFCNHKKQENPFAGKVKCVECKHWVDEVDAKRVTRQYQSSGMFFYGQDKSYLWYCEMHKKPYDLHKSSTYGEHFYLLNQTVEVTAEGMPIAPKKK